MLESFRDSSWVKCSDPCVGLDPLVAWYECFCGPAGCGFLRVRYPDFPNRWLKATTLPSSRAWQVPLFAVYLWSFRRQGENPTIEAADGIASLHGLPCYPMTHVNQCGNTHVFANGLETVRVKWHIFKVPRNGLLRYILYTCPNKWCNSCSKCYEMDCFGTYFAHVQTSDVTCVQSATEWTASVHTLHMSNQVM